MTDRSLRCICLCLQRFVQDSLGVFCWSQNQVFNPLRQNIELKLESIDEYAHMYRKDGQTVCYLALIKLKYDISDYQLVLLLGPSGTICIDY